MLTPTEQKTIQTQIPQYAEAIGWTLVSREAVEQLGHDLRVEYPGLQGFSADNLWRTRQFFREYSSPGFLSQAARDAALHRQTRFLEHAVPETGTPILEQAVPEVPAHAVRAKRRRDCRLAVHRDAEVRYQSRVDEADGLRRTENATCFEKASRFKATGTTGKRPCNPLQGASSMSYNRDMNRDIVSRSQEPLKSSRRNQ